jgi:septum site-determining protein MinC
VSGPPPPGASNALYVPSTVRSGQRIVHEGHLVICGDVNAGAEVMASGDVLIFGTLRGLAHAGCLGDETARIVASSLRPPQLRIAAKIARAPEEAPTSGKNISTVGKSGPEVARIVNGEIQVYPL